MRTIDAAEASLSRSSQSWVMLINRVFKVNPLSPPQGGGQMAVVGFFEPPQDEVVEKILCGYQSAADHRFASVPVSGLWRSLAPKAPPDADGLVQELDSAFSDQLQELTYVDMLLATL